MSGDGGSRLPARLSRAVAGAALAIFLPAAGPSALTLESASPLHGTATLFHPHPFARVDNAVAAVVNPAGLGVRYGSDLYGMITDSDNLRDGDFAVLVKLRRLGLS